KHLAADAPVPATFRAQAIGRFNQSIETGEQLRLGWVGVPGREIVTKAADPVLAATLRHLAAEPEPKPVTESLTVGGEPLLRTIYPSIAAQQSCVDCHNAMTPEKPAWRRGEMMGAFALDVPAGGFLRRTRDEAAALGLAVFVAIGGMGFF